MSNLTVSKGSYAAVAMSGGVDSSVVAAILLEQGVNIIGVTMLHKKNSQEQDLADVKEVCSKLGIKHIAINIVDEYQDFLDREVRSIYAQGLTPNPCVICNEKIKFGLFFDSLLRYELPNNFPNDCYWVSGHYATISQSSDGKYYRVGKGNTLAKDQSYFLYRLGQHVLSRLRFPLGDLDKPTVRLLAEKYNLAVKKKIDSQDFCLGEGELRPLIEKPVRVVDKTGKLVSTGAGLSYYTIGQRRGLGISSSDPLYVISLNPEKNEVVVGQEEDLMSTRFRVGNLVWSCFAEFPLRAMVKIRSMSKEKPCIINKISESLVEVILDFSERAITPGQSAVFYNGQYVVGGGYISPLVVY